MSTPVTSASLSPAILDQAFRGRDSLLLRFVAFMGTEDLVERVAQHVDGTVDDKQKWERGLKLSRGATEDQLIKDLFERTDVQIIDAGANLYFSLGGTVERVTRIFQELFSEHATSSRLRAADLFVAGRMLKVAQDAELQERVQTSLREAEETVSPLATACLAGNLDQVRELIDLGANLNWRSPQQQQTVLHNAVWGGNFEIVRLVVEQNPNLLPMRTAGGNSARDLADVEGSQEILEFLTEQETVFSAPSSDAAVAA